MPATDTFKDKVRESWGTPKAVADAAIAETFRHGDIITSFDLDDQVDRARDIGILAGKCNDSTPDEFIRQFEEKFLSEG